MRKSAKNRGVQAESYTHDGARRKNIPEAGLVDYEPKAKGTKKSYCWDPRESPQLIWAGKAGMKRVEVERKLVFVSTPVPP